MTHSAPATPPVAPLRMPTQTLSRHPGTRVRAHGQTTGLARLLTFGGSTALTLVAAIQLSAVLPQEGAMGPLWTVALGLLLGLFTITFGWIALSACAACAGVLWGGDRRRAAADAPLRGHTALVMPVYNEDPASACAALYAMARDLDRPGLREHFELFMLSDTANPDIAASERRIIARLQERLTHIMPVWYRRRDRNTARKAGNIRDFIHRWGERYDYMVVLDADSLISGDTLAALVREMDADSDAGILQTLPRLYGGQTLYARLQQFAGSLYGPVFACGLSAWQGQDGNYWGHNAIIRIRAFAESAGLPDIPGRRPFGGEILSHDFVEAALIRRAGWTVRMLPGLPGSWEESPPSLLDAAVRDRRWAQGNVQHLAVLPARGLRWPSRVHMLMGVMNYLTSPLWMTMVLAGLVLSTIVGMQSAAPAVFDSQRMIGLFLLTMALLLFPKMIGVASAAIRRRTRNRSGFVPAAAGALIELLFSILQAPIFMLLHSRFLWEIARRQDSGWSAQRRRGSSAPWSMLARRHFLHTLAGLAITVWLLWLQSPLLYWLLPMIAGLILAIPLSALSGSIRAGQWLARHGLLVTAEERAEPVLMRRRRRFQADCKQLLEAGSDDGNPVGPPR